MVTYLQPHHGEVVSRAWVLQDVWGDEFDGGSNVVDSAIRSIRRKLGPHASSTETVRGFGCRNHL